MNRLVLFVAGAVLMCANLVLGSFLPESVYFADANTGWVCGRVTTYSEEKGYNEDHDVILKTEDGGKKWRVVLKKESKDSWSDKKIIFLDANMGLICMGGELFKTADKGETWFCLNKSSQINSLSFINKTIGWALGGDAGIGSESVFKTVDGGKTWLKVGKDAQLPSILRAIFFKDEKTGWVGGGYCSNGGYRNLPGPRKGEIIKTIDGGKNWFKQENYPNINPNPRRVWTPDAIFEKIQFTDNQNGWAITENSQLFKTSNGGNSWEMIYLWDMRISIEAFFFIGSTGWLVGDKLDSSNVSTTPSYGSILKITNNGKSWSRQFLFKQAGEITDIYFMNVTTGWAVGHVGWDDNGVYKSKNYLLKTTDGGKKWSLSQIWW
jgi:photosystem II stability/assembly factor-like uncharacterized protein